MSDGRVAPEDDCCSCCWWWCSCCGCFSPCVDRCLEGEKQSKRYAQISYKPLPQTQPGYDHAGLHRHGYRKQHSGVYIPQDMKHLLDRSVLQHNQPPPYVVRQQPKSTSSRRAGAKEHSSQRQKDSSAGKRDSSSSEGSPTPKLTRLRSAFLTPQKGDEEDTIDISQSPTGTFSSAYRRSQKRRSYPIAGQSTPSPHQSIVQGSSSDDQQEEKAHTHREREMTATSEVEPKPTLQLSMYYHVESERLSVCLHSAQNLPPKTSRWYSVLVQLIPEAVEAREMRVPGDECNPSLALSFDISNVARDRVRQSKLVIHWYDGATTGVLLGSAVVQLDQADLFGMMCTVALTHEDAEPNGELLVSLCYNNRTSVIEGILLKLTNSRMIGDKTGIPDIFVKIYLIYKGKRSRYWKSTSKQSSFSLIFNEAFQFDTRNKDMRYVSLEVCVLTHEKSSRDTLIGRVRVGDRAVDESGRQHWSQIMSQPLARISRWHSFSPSDSPQKFSP